MTSPIEPLEPLYRTIPCNEDLIQLAATSPAQLNKASTPVPGRYHQKPTQEPPEPPEPLKPWETSKYGVAQVICLLLVTFYGGVIRRDLSKSSFTILA